MVVRVATIILAGACDLMPACFRTSAPDQPQLRSQAAELTTDVPGLSRRFDQFRHSRGD
jgi:hypothetical protein